MVAFTFWILWGANERLQGSSLAQSLQQNDKCTVKVSYFYNLACLILLSLIAASNLKNLISTYDSCLIGGERKCFMLRNDNVM